MFRSVDRANQRRNQNGGKGNVKRSIENHRGITYRIRNVIHNRIWGVSMMASSVSSKVAVAVLLTLSTTCWHPSGGEFKCYMDYRAITSTGSPQYQLQQEAWTDKCGLRRVGCFYCVALGSAFGSEIGTHYVVTLSSGKKIPVILADQKADGDTTQDNTRDHNGAVIEFVVDTPALPSVVRATGDVGSISMFGGSVKEIRRLDYAGMR